MNKNKKALQELMAFGKQYDNETDPEKREALKKEIEERCAELKGKLSDTAASVSSQDEPNEECL